MARAIAAVVAVVALVAGAIWLVRPREGEDPQAWETKAQQAFRPLVNAVPDLVRGAREWQAGERPTDVFTEQVRRSVTDFTQTRDRVADLKPSPESKDAGELYENSAQLYIEVGRIYEVMLAVPPGELRSQLDLLARRVRELGDRVYDRGHAALVPFLDEQETPGVERRLPEEVPMWQAEGLAAGPPLDDAPGPPASSPPLREETRPEQSRGAWEREVRRAGMPPPSELDDALADADAHRLRELSRRFAAVAERLREEPDPQGNRERSAVLRLGLLVNADAARAGQAATLIEGDDRRRLASVGQALAAVGKELVDEAEL